MKKPRLKRNRPVAYLSSADFPIGKFLKHCPLPPELEHLEPIMHGPLGQSLISSIAVCLGEGFTYAQLEEVARLVVDFYAEEWHRCNACHNWTKDFAGGAVVIDGEFKIAVVCAKCGALVQAGRATKAMDRNVAEHVLGGAK